MNLLSFKKISSYYFPTLVEKSHSYGIYNNIISFFNSIAVANNDNEILTIAENFSKFEQMLHNDEKEQYEEPLKSVKQVLNLSVALIKEPLEVAFNLDTKIDILIKQQDIHIPKYALQCAILSIIGIIINPNISENIKQKHFAIQQKYLNLAIQTNWDDRNSVNYWYALHYYIKGSHKNSVFFINSLLKEVNKYEKDLMIDKSMAPWLRDKIPKEFHDFVYEQYHDWLKK